MPETPSAILHWESVLSGDRDPQLLACGHSHVLCMAHALAEGMGPGVRAAVALNANDLSFWDMVVDHSAGRVVAIVWNGNQHNVHFLLQAGPPFRLFDPLAHDVVEGRGKWVAREAIRALFEPTFAELDNVMTRLVPLARVVLLGTPPPKPETAVRSGVESEAFFVQRASELGFALGDLRVSPESLRVSLWRLVQEMLMDSARSHGAEFVPVPASVMSSDGLLLPEFSVPDVTHANSAYGAQMWGCLAAYAKGQQHD